MWVPACLETCVYEENVNFNNANEMCERHTGSYAHVAVMIADPLHYRFAWLLLVLTQQQQQRGKNINSARLRVKNKFPHGLAYINFYRDV